MNKALEPASVNNPSSQSGGGSNRELGVKLLVNMGFEYVHASQAISIMSILNRRQQRILEVWENEPILARAMIAQGCLQSGMRDGQEQRTSIAARAMHVAAMEFSRTNRARDDNLYLFLRFDCAHCKSLSLPIKYNHFISGRCPRFECHHSWEDFTNRDQRKRFNSFSAACEEFNIHVGERLAIHSLGGRRNYLRNLVCKLCFTELADCREASLLGGVKPKHRYSFGGTSLLCPKVEGVEKLDFVRNEHGIEAFPDLASDVERAARLLATHAMDKVPVRFLNCGHSGVVWKLALLKPLKNVSNGCPDCSDSYRHSARAAKILGQEHPTKQDLEWAKKPARVVVCRTRAISNDGKECLFIKVGVTNANRYDRSEVLLQYETSQLAAYTIEQNILASCPQFFGAALGMNLVDLGNAGHSETASLDSYPIIQSAFKAAVDRWIAGDRRPAKNSYRFRATPLGIRSASGKRR